MKKKPFRKRAFL